MTKFKDISGKRFGRLIALHRLHNTKGKTKWLCICDCGNITEVKLNSLNNGDTRSCGCLHTELMKKQFSKHGKSGTRLHRIWKNIKTRCYNENTPQFKNWGGRGITMCDEWRNNFQTFYEWSINNGYQENLNYSTLFTRVYNLGWSIEKALNYGKVCDTNVEYD